MTWPIEPPARTTWLLSPCTPLIYADLLGSPAVWFAKFLTLGSTSRVMLSSRIVVRNIEMDISHYVTQIVTAYMGCNKVAADQLPYLIKTVHNALCRYVLSASYSEAETRPASFAPRRPAIPIAGAVQPDYLICLEDGRRMKSLKRHLRAAHGLSVEEYAERWDLPTDYPMVAPNYSLRQSQHAKDMGLGHGKHKRRLPQG